MEFIVLHMTYNRTVSPSTMLVKSDSINQSLIIELRALHGQRKRKHERIRDDGSFE